MTSEESISFEEWVVWMFDRRERDWAWAVEEDDHPWLYNGRLLTEHFIRLHENPTPVLQPYSNDQIGWGLWWLYSSYAAVAVPFLDDDVPGPMRHEAVRSVAVLLSRLVPGRLPKHDRVVEDPLGRTLYMFWEILPVWPFDPTDEDRAMRDVCIEEMRSSLAVDHVIARFHALHGLGHFTLEVPDQAREIIDGWLATGPEISPVLAEYARQARDGRVQ